MTDRDDTRAALEDAIRAHLATYPSGHGVLTDWVVIAAQETVNDNGESASSIGIALPAEAFPLHRILGLIDHAKVQYHTLLGSWRPDTE